MTTGKNDSREHISSDSRRKAAERNKNDFQIYKSKPQSSSRKSKLLILKRSARIEPYPEDGTSNLMLKMKNIVKEKRQKLNNDIETVGNIRERQSSDAYEKRLKKNEKIKQGTRKGKSHQKCRYCRGCGS